MRFIIVALLFTCLPALVAMGASPVAETSAAPEAAPAAASGADSAEGSGAETLAQPSEIQPSLFRAVYKADYKGLPISAKGIRELTLNAQGHYFLSSKATSMFASITETTEFKIAGSDVIPLEYQYHRSGIGRKRDAVLSFDWETNSVLNNVQAQPWRMDVPLGAMDKLLYQFKLREDLKAAYEAGAPWPELDYIIADGGKLKNYTFKVIGEEEIDTPLGKMMTIKASRIKDNRNRESTFWLAPEYDFLLVRFQQLEADGDGFELLLREAEFEGRQL